MFFFPRQFLHELEACAKNPDDVPKVILRHVSNIYVAYLRNEKCFFERNILASVDKSLLLLLHRYNHAGLTIFSRDPLSLLSAALALDKFSHLLFTRNPNLRCTSSSLRVDRLPTRSWKTKLRANFGRLVKH